MQCDPGIMEAVVDRLETLQRTGINVIDCRAHEDEMLHVRAIAQHAIDRIFQKTGVGEIEAFINSDSEGCI